jgi:hypothetical protein
MRTTTITCDRCGSDADNGHVVLSIQAGTTPTTWPTDIETGRPTRDLCAACMTALSAWMSGATPRPECTASPGVGGVTIRTATR